MNILIGNAWPYANGSLHVGHIASLLPGDVIARYYRAAGENVCLVSGSDCYGTPVSIRAKEENKTPEEISDGYHREFAECFQKLGFSYDRYGKTTSGEHRDFIRDFHRRLYESAFVYEKETPAAFCEVCCMALADRYVTGRCPQCGKAARGDQCDACGTVLEPQNLQEPVCAVCGGPVAFGSTKHLTIALTKLEPLLRRFLEERPHWPQNAKDFTRRYLDEGLRDRALTRDLQWGIDVPKEGYEEKRIYIWAENVLGYLSMSKAALEERGESFERFLGENSRHYYVHGKDNIPFHTIILPALLLCEGSGWRLPDQIVSSEHLTLEGRKISTSQNWAVWVKDLLERFQPDSIRYFLLAHGPEKKDSDFSFRELVRSHNKELLGIYGNLVNRTLRFIHQYCAAAIPKGRLTAETEKRTGELFSVAGSLIEADSIKEAITYLFDFARFGNRYFDAEKPWETRGTDPAACGDTLYNCVQIIANLAVCLQPFLPFSSEKVLAWLGLDSRWAVKSVPAGLAIPQPEILFERLPPGTAEAELERLKVKG